MYISKADRDSIVDFLSGIVATPQTGASIMTAINFLSNLPEEKPVIPAEQAKK